MREVGHRRRDTKAQRAALAATLSGLCASLVGIGLARFAYTPLLPAIVGAHWFDATQAAYIGAANLAGYLAGALLGRPLAYRLSEAVTLRGMMLLATLAFFACAHPTQFVWFSAWRFVSGVAGGSLMVLAAPAALRCVPPTRRGMASGVIFMGVGAGVVASGTLVPLLLRHGLRVTWDGLGAISTLLSAFAWAGWSSAYAAAPLPHAPEGAIEPSPFALRALFAQYALSAVGLVPHMVFLVAFVARGLGRGFQAGAEDWVLFGLGAMIGPLLAGALGDRIGFARTLRMAWVLEAAAVALPILDPSLLGMIVSSIVVGCFVTGVVSLALGRIHELLLHHPSRQGAAWRSATVAFALAQAVAAYGYSYLFSLSAHAYGPLFVLGAAALGIALLIDLAVGNSEARARFGVNG